MQVTERKEEGVGNSDTDITSATSLGDSVETERVNTYSRFRSMSDNNRYLAVESSAILSLIVLSSLSSKVMV